MANPGFEAFLWSLTQQESGGNYHAVGQWVNGDRAYGRYQVMGANVGSWTAKYYGRRLTPQEYLGNPAAQDAVVRGVLGGYYQRYGARGAAAAWYSGNPNLHMSTRPQPGGPSIKGYVDSVMQRAAGYSGGGGGGSFSTAPVKVKLNRNELAESYGLTAALINSNKSLKRLFEQAVAGSWSATKWGAELKNSSWWKRQSNTLRKYLLTKYIDPATFKQNWVNGQYKINQLAVQVGLGSQIGKGGRSSDLLKQAIYNSLALGWADARVKDWLGTRAAIHGEIMWGEAGEAFDKLHTIAYANGMRYSADWYKKRAMAVASGKSTTESVEDRIRREAAAKYSAFAEQIKAGQNAIDLAAPYIKTVSQLLELPETDVDLFNKHVGKAMGGASYPLWQLENDVRNDPLWRKTNNARESAFGVGHEILRQFGMAF